jgi:hypothetical protein
VDTIKIDLKEIGWGGADLINLAQEKDQWRALLNTFGCHKMLGNY